MQSVASESARRPDPQSGSRPIPIKPELAENVEAYHHVFTQVRDARDDGRRRLSSCARDVNEAKFHGITEHPPGTERRVQFNRVKKLKRERIGNRIADERPGRAGVNETPSTHALRQRSSLKKLRLMSRRCGCKLESNARSARVDLRVDGSARRDRPDVRYLPSE